MRRATSVGLSLGLLALAACSGGGGGGPGPADVGGNPGGDAGVGPDRAEADGGDVTDAGVAPEPAEAGRDSGTDTGVAPDPADVRPEGGPDIGVAADSIDAIRNDGRETGLPLDVAEAGRDSGRDVGVVPADLAPAGDAGAPLPWPTGKYISIDEVYARLQARDPDMLLVNVVDEQYYDLGHLAGSLKIPYDTLAGRLGELDRTRHIVIYCRRGVRSETAYTTLTGNGFSLVWVMEGGIEPWIAAGYPVVPD